MNYLLYIFSQRKAGTDFTDNLGITGTATISKCNTLGILTIAVELSTTREAT
jgi:hypothetical protein